MAKVTLAFSHLSKAGHTLAEILRIVQSLEAAGINVNLQIRGQESLKLLGQLPALQKQSVIRPRFGLISLLLVGVLASLISLTYGLVGLFL